MARFAGIGEVRLVQQVAGNRIEPVSIDRLNVRRALDTVGGGSVGGHVKGLVGVVGAVEVVGTEDLVFGVEVVIHAAKDRGIADGVVDGQTFVVVEIGLEKAQESLPLTITAGGDLRVGDVTAGSEDWIGDSAGRAQGHG
jgi:hypothetical protein